MEKCIYRFAAVLLVMMFCVVARCQEMITISENPAKTQNVSTLNGKAAVVFEANSDDMVITTSIKNDPQQPKAVKVGAKYQYEMIVDISRSSARYFTVTKYGTTNSQKTDKVILGANKRMFFDIDQVETGIDMKLDPNANMGWINGKKGQALIEFNSKIKIKINCPNLKHEPIRSGRHIAGTYLDSLIFDATQYVALAQKESALQEELETASRRMAKEAETMDDSTYEVLRNRIPILTEELNSVSAELANLLKIEVSGDKTNTIVIDYNLLKNMSPMGFLRYNILILNETKVVVETQYGELLRQADNEFQDRQYARAAEFYRLASNEKDITDTQRNVALDKAYHALRYDTIQIRAEKYAKMINEIVSQKKEVKKNLLIQAFDQAIIAYRSLANSTGDSYFKDQMEKLITEKEKIGIILEGITYYSELHQGIADEKPLGGCKFYGVSGYVSDNMKTDVYWRNNNELATSNSDGSFKFQVKSSQYDYIIVVGAHNGKIKSNKVIPMKGRSDSKLKIVFGKK